MQLQGMHLSMGLTNRKDGKSIFFEVSPIPRLVNIHSNYRTESSGHLGTLIGATGILPKLRSGTAKAIRAVYERETSVLLTAGFTDQDTIAF